MLPTFHFVIVVTKLQCWGLKCSEHSVYSPWEGFQGSGDRPPSYTIPFIRGGSIPKLAFICAAPGLDPPKYRRASIFPQFRPGRFVGSYFGLAGDIYTFMKDAGGINALQGSYVLPMNENATLRGLRSTRGHVREMGLGAYCTSGS